MASEARPLVTLVPDAQTQRVSALVIAALAIGGVALALWQLFVPLRPLQITQTQLDDMPITVFEPPGGGDAAVVIAHGFAGSQQLMYPFAVTLARDGYTAITLDFPGHGQNTTPLRGQLLEQERRSAQLSAALDRAVAYARQADRPVVLLGHSMGAEAVVRYAQAHPEIKATAAVSMFYEGVRPSSPRNLLLVTGALESQLAPTGQRIIDVAAGVSSGAKAGVTYGSPSEGTARRLVFAPTVEHIGVLFSGTSMTEATLWFDQMLARSSVATAWEEQRLRGGPPVATPFVDRRAGWLGLLYLSASALFWPLSRLVRPLVASPADTSRRSWLGWLLAALLPALATPLVLRALPVDSLLPILVGGPLAVFFAIYGLLTALLLYLTRDRSSGGAAPMLRLAAMSWRSVLPVALLIVGYVFLTFGLPAQLFVLNYFAPPARLGVFVAVLLAMLPYFLADEALTRGPGRPRGAYALSKVCFMLALALAILIDGRLFFLTLIAPLFVLYFAVYGWFSGLIYRRTGTLLPGALANAAIFAWSVAAVFPLVG